MQKFTIPVDPGYMFDFLSIYQVKSSKVLSLININNFVTTSDHIKKQITDELFEKIINSSEYINLYEINERLFNLVDAVKKDPCLGKQLDDEVYNRYLAKKSLQEKFFPEIKVNEQKFGYEQKS